MEVRLSPFFVPGSSYARTTARGFTVHLPTRGAQLKGKISPLARPYPEFTARGFTAASMSGNSEAARESFSQDRWLDQATMRAVRRAMVGLIEHPCPFPLVEDQSEVFRGPDQLLCSANRIAGIRGNNAPNRSTDQQSAKQRQYESTHENTLHPWIGVAGGVPYDLMSRVGRCPFPLLVNPKPG